MKSTKSTKPTKPTKPESHPRLRRARRYLLVGLLTAAPLWITWLVFEFLFTQLSHIGAPWVFAAARAVRPWSPAVSDFLIESWLQSLVAVGLTLLVLYVLGWGATRVLGRRVIDLVESVLQRIPLVAAIYGGVKRFLAVVEEQPSGVQRVVLIEFPSRDMKAVGFVTRIMTDETTGAQLAAVYVPTSPNPTSGYIEIVPVDRLVSTDWTLDEAMRFVITAGANAPERVRYHAPDAIEGAPRTPAPESASDRDETAGPASDAERTNRPAQSKTPG